MVPGKLRAPGRPTNLDSSRSRAYCACSMCGRGLFGHFFLSSIISLFRGWSGGAMALGKLLLPGRPTIWKYSTAIVKFRFVSGLGDRLSR